MLWRSYYCTSTWTQRREWHTLYRILTPNPNSNPVFLPPNPHLQPLHLTSFTLPLNHIPEPFILTLRLNHYPQTLSLNVYTPARNQLPATLIQWYVRTNCIRSNKLIGHLYCYPKIAVIQQQPHPYNIMIETTWWMSYYNMQDLGQHTELFYKEQDVILMI